MLSVMELIIVNKLPVSLQLKVRLQGLNNLYNFFIYVDSQCAANLTVFLKAVLDTLLSPKQYSHPQPSPTHFPSSCSSAKPPPSHPPVHHSPSLAAHHYPQLGRQMVQRYTFPSLVQKEGDMSPMLVQTLVEEQQNHSKNENKKQKN